MPQALLNHESAGDRRLSAEPHRARTVSAFELSETHDGEERAAIETFIAQRYAQQYGARIRHFLPQILALRDRRGELIAAFGLRHAADAPLFLENYLDAPVDQHLSALTGLPLRRDDVVEVGNLAGRHPGALRLVIRLLSEHLAQGCARWVVFTGGPRLLNGFERLGVPLLSLGEARLERLPADERADWGRYYEAEPSVMCANVRVTRRHLALTTPSA